jgi:hypothetical protein
MNRITSEVPNGMVYMSAQNASDADKSQCIGLQMGLPF